ncbi:MAG TPA: DEAD/DEAH box helicase [Planctomycetota bacterium]
MRFQNGSLIWNGRGIPVDAVDALLVRTLQQMPALPAESGTTAAFPDQRLIGTRDFAPVLALLRQASSACDVSEDGRVSQVEVLATPAQPILEIVQVPQASPTEAVPRIIARAHFRCPESDENLGQPALRSTAYWTFSRHISPPPDLPDDSVLKGIFEAAGQTSHTFCGHEALDLVRRAQAAGRKGLPLRLDERLRALKLSDQTLRSRVRVMQNTSGEIVVRQELLTPDGQVVDSSSLIEKTSAKSEEPGDKEQKAASREPRFLTVSGRTYRVPDSVAAFRLQPERRLNGDDAADFVSDELPKLKAEGAAIDSAVESLRVCRALKPTLSVTPDEGNPEAVQAQWCFEAFEADPHGQTTTNDGRPCHTEIAPLEILAAAAKGQRYLRHGDVFVRVDRHAVSVCRKQLENVQALADTGGHAQGEQVAELLSWAKKAASDVHTPWNVYVAEAVEGAHKVKDAPAAVNIRLDTEEEEGEPWFTLNATFDHDGEQLTEDELRKLVQQGRKWFRKGNAWIKVDAQALEKFEHGVRESGMHQQFRSRARQFYYRFKPAARELVTDIFSIAGTIEHTQRYKKFQDQLRGFESIEQLPTPAGMALTLRSYQQRGFEWLAFLAHYGLNGVLADDMGLGKTAQTLAAIARMKETSGQGPALIVTPTSLLENWRNESAKFTPGLRVLIYRGSPSRRDRLRQELAGYDIVLGTYATVRNDASLLRMIEWRYVILDEAHFIKNSAAATTKAVKTIPAKHRLALTGTPIQNRLSELWSLFDFLMPGFLGRQTRFLEGYEEPIARMQSGRSETRDEETEGQEALGHLRERIRPFVLRRLKTDVASELPPKIENDVFCSLSPEQVALYRSFGESAEAKQAVSEVVAKGVDGACTAILAALTALRKICNHPDLMCLPKNSGRQRIAEPLPGYETRSGKLEALGELLQQCREGGHRALIFCQQTSMLDLLGHYLSAQRMKYLRLDGETPPMNRQALVDRFNKETDIDAFLISTRAGGAGLNLTGADTVIFYDHDWNPANDQQAQDRAYRIGQLKTVNVYRLICKGTLEEKILRRQALKRMLADSIVQCDGAGLKALTREELLGLFTLTVEEPENAGH